MKMRRGGVLRPRKDMGDFLSGGPCPYPLEEALWDACFWLQMEEAVSHPWQETVSRPMPWNARRL